MRCLKKFVPLLLIIVLFFYLRLNHLKEIFNFGTDQGLGMIEAYQIFQTKKMPLIGMTGSSWTFEGRYIFFGSLPYLLYLPVFILSKWNPLSMAYLFIFLQFVSLLLLYFVISKYRSRKLAVTFGIIYASFPLVIEHSRYLWGPNLLIPVSSFLLSFLILAKEKRKLIYFFIIGLIMGLGLQMHYSFILACFLAALYLFINVKRNSKWFIILPGFLLGVSNLILFELRHDLYNTKTLLYFLSKLNNLNQGGVFHFNSHYLLPVVVFLIYLFSVLLIKINEKTSWIILTAAVCMIIAVNFPIPTHGFTMREGWNYEGVKKVEKIILAENKKGYNLVDLLTGDTRAMALRSLLILSRNPPLGITDYQATDYLFIYSKDTIEKILAGSLYELDSVRPVKLVQTWEVQNGISLYLLARQMIK